MASDRGWIGRNRFDESRYLTEEYKDGVENFIKFAYEHIDDENDGLIRCPCKHCGNEYFKDLEAVKVDLYRYGIMHWYTKWDLHGEKDIPLDETGTSSAYIGYMDDDMYDARDMLRDFKEANRNFENVGEEPNAAAKEFYKMMNAASQPIYLDNVNFTTLSFVNKLLHFKNKHNCSNSGFDDLLQLIGSVLPDDHKLPKSYYDVRKMIKGLNMGYEKIDACENDFMLFYKEDSWKTHCDICNQS